MPLLSASKPPTRSDTHYVVYFGSGEPSWCVDSRDSLPALRAVFSDSAAPTAYIVRVGKKEEWKDNPHNMFRHAPYNIQGVPTVVKVKNGREIARVGDSECRKESALLKLLNI